MLDSKNKIGVLGLCVMGWVFGGVFSRAQAGAMGIENGNGTIQKAPVADTVNVTDDSGEEDSSSWSNPSSRVTLSYFLSSGYAAENISDIPAIGHIDGTPEIDHDLTNSKSLYVVVSSDQIKLTPNEKLIVFEDQGPLRFEKSNFNKRFIQNVAILQVKNGHGRRYLADVIAEYNNIANGSPVKLYEGEKKLWEEEQVAVEPPTHPVTCYVAGGTREKDWWDQTDYVILTAGTREGVVPGLTFEFWEVPLDKTIEAGGISRGFAKVFYAGADYCIAKIREGSGSIYQGYEAVYKP